jgi:ParB family chromosome partitioning protein
MLPREVQEEIRNGRISYAHGRALLEIADDNLVRKLAQETISKGFSVRELENLIKMRRPRASRHRIRALAGRDPLVAVLEEDLQHALGTKVRIVRRKKRGTITVEFYSQEDLERIVGKIKGDVTA